MLGSVPTTPKSIEAYRPVIGESATDEILGLAAQLKGARVLHVNATAFGGGVAEILGTLVPLMNDLGLVADWQVIKGADEFFNVTKAMHNSLQGMYYDWTPAMRDTWLEYNKLNADLFDENYDYVVIHDPQPAAIPAFLEERTGARHGKWVWRCHIDITDAQVQVWDLLRPHVERYDGAIFTLKEYVKDDLEHPQIFCVPPAIDPLSPKNAELAEDTVNAILKRYGVDPARPMVTQISRFDPWKDPLGVIDVYRAVKKDIPDLQLVMIASMASDDPEGWDWYERTVRRAGEDFDIHILSNLNGVGNIEVNAFQRAARVVIQKSIREGFGLVVSEALWKGRPVVAGNVGGIPLQIENGQTGFLVNTNEECIEKLLFLLRHREEADMMGASGVEYVREKFLTTRYLRDYLNIFCQLSGLQPDAALAQTQQVHR
jgi:trehalose synthase